MTSSVRRQILLLIGSISLASAQGQDDRRPNVVLIMADDLGAENLACYGNSVYQTPHLDRMASEGARFENAFATPVCSPTRAMILTGLHPNRTGIMERLDSPLDQAKANRLPDHFKTLGHLFHSAGYATAIAGKWHLGDFQAHPDQPTSHGFDTHCLWVQYWDGQRRSRYYGPHNWENGEYRAHSNDVFGPDYYCDFLIKFLKQHRASPFFAYFPMNLIHGPLITPPGDQASAEIGYPDDLGKSERLVGRMIHYMDSLVGRLFDTIEMLERDEQTLVIFTGDNGTAGNLVSRLGDFHLRGGKRTMNEAGTRVPLIARWPGTIPSGTRQGFFSLVDMLPTLAAMARIPVEHPVDGLDLSHYFYDRPGRDREQFLMAFEGGLFFVRDKRFRLHEDGRLYDVPVSWVDRRYGMEVSTDWRRHLAARRRLQSQLNDFKNIRQRDESYRIIPFGTRGDRFKNEQDKARQRAR